MFHSELPRISDPLDNVSNINVTSVMKYQLEKPDGSRNFTDVWRVEIRGEGFDTNGDRVWRMIMFHVELDISEIGVGPIVGDTIVEDIYVKDQETLPYLPIAFILIIFMLAIKLRIINRHKKILISCNTFTGLLEA